MNKWTFVLRSLTHEQIVKFTIEIYDYATRAEVYEEAYSWLLKNGYMAREAFYKVELLKLNNRKVYKQ